ncbi:MAG: hypothetical protein ACYCW6_10875 [Candidatus Xenobia bacterium]
MDTPQRYEQLEKLFNANPGVQLLGRTRTALSRGVDNDGHPATSRITFEDGVPVTLEKITRLPNGTLQKDVYRYENGKPVHTQGYRVSRDGTFHESVEVSVPQREEKPAPRPIVMNAVVNPALIFKGNPAALAHAPVPPRLIRSVTART